MSKPLTEAPDDLAADEMDALGTPSQTREADPNVFRTVGLVGGCFLLFGIGMWVWNYFGDAENPTFRPTWIRLWWLVGGVLTLIHSVQDRDQTVRRGYGAVAFALLLFGSICLAVTLTISLGTAAALSIAAVVGILALAVAAAPFVRDELKDGTAEAPAGFYPYLQNAVLACARFPGRWLKALAASAKVQQVTIAVGLAVLVCLVFGQAFRQTDLIPYGLGALGLGLLFMMPFTGRETNASWRDAATYMVGLIGWLTTLLALVNIGADWVQLERMGPVQVGVFGTLGLVFLCVFVSMRGSDSDSGHNTAVLLGALGLIVLVLVVARCFVPFLQFEAADRIPLGVLFGLLGGLFAAAGLGLVADLPLVVMTRRELAAFFFSPVAYIVLACMVLWAWASFEFTFLGELLPPTDVPPTMQRGAPAVPEPIIRFYFFSLLPVWCLTIAVPMITMRLLSEEQRTGTMEVLLTAPVTEVAVVLSKFIAAWLFFMLSWGIWAVFPVALRVIGKESFDLVPLLNVYVTMAFIAAGFMGMGVFWSSITRNQIIAFILTVVCMILMVLPLFIMGNIEGDQQASAKKLEFIKFVSYLFHLREAGEGKLQVRYLLFHGSQAVLWLFLTVKVLEARKWR